MTVGHCSASDNILDHYTVTDPNRFRDEGL